MPVDRTINIFVTGIQPIWEVPEHAVGGEWVIRINKGHANLLWENLLLGFIGEQFTLENEVTGVVLRIGLNFDKISIWFRSGRN